METKILMKKIIVMVGQNDQNYGQRLIYRKIHSILKEKGVESVFPKMSMSMIGMLPFYDGVLFAGKIRGFLEDLIVLDAAIELGKPVFFFGLNVENTKNYDLYHLSTILMSPLISGFVTDEVSLKWASLWAGSRIKKGIDLANIYLIDRAKHEKSKFAIFAPSKDGILRSCVGKSWFPKMDSKVIVEDPGDSETAAKFAQQINAEDVVLLFQTDDIIRAVQNAKFVLSEKFYVTLTACAFGVPFSHIGRKALRYFGKNFSENTISEDEIELALAIQNLKDMESDRFHSFNLRISEEYRSMIDDLNEFLK